jgi:hypothetical protein
VNLHIGKYQIFDSYFHISFTKKWKNALKYILEWQLNLGFVSINKYKNQAIKHNAKKPAETTVTTMYQKGKKPITYENPSQAEQAIKEIYK